MRRETRNWRLDLAARKAFALIVACTVLLSGCGKKPSPEKAPDKPRPSTELPAPTTTTVSAPSTTTQLSAGDFDAAYHEVLKLEAQGKFSQALALCRKARSQFRSHARVSELEEGQVRLQDAKREGLQLGIAVKNLGSKNVLTAHAARMELKSAGSTALILLRNALRSNSGKVALEAAKLLGEARDAEAIPFFLRVLQDEAEPMRVTSATEVLCKMPELLQFDQLAACYEILEGDENFKRIEVAGVLQAVFDKVCGGDITNFNARVGDADAYRTVRGHIERALVSDDATVVDWVTRRGGTSVGTVNAFRGRYYHDQKFNEKQLVMDRFDPRVYVVHAHPPFPSNRQENVSIRWTADLDVKEEALYYFHLRGDDKASLWIDGKPVLTSTANSERSVSNRLSRGLHPLRVDFVNGPSAARAWLNWSGPGFGKQPVMPVYSSPRAAFVDELQEAIATLATNDWKLARQAKTKIAMGDGTAAILLRHTFMTGPPELGEEALELLVRRDDERMPELLLQKLEAKPDRRTAFTFLRALRDLSPQVPQSEYQVMLQRVQADAGISMIPEAVALCGVLEKVCHGKGQDFNDRVGEADAHETLAAYVSKALVSSDLETVIRAACFGAPIAPYVAALESQAYLGEDFEEFSHDKRYTRIYAPNYQLGFPKSRYLDVSVRWSGGLQIAKAGTYVFDIWSDGPSKFWIDGTLIQSRAGYVERKSELKLEPGFHPLKYEIRQRTGNSRVDLYWSGEGFERQHIGTNVLRTPLWHAAADRLVAGIAVLGSTNTTLSEKSWTRFKNFAPASDFLLLHALKSSSGPNLSELVRYVAESDDGRAVPILLQRLRKQPAAEDLRALTDGLVALVEKIDMREFPALYAAFGKGAGMPPEAAVLCAALVHVCDGKQAEFNKLTGNAAAYGTLRAHVGDALIQENIDVVTRACVYGWPFTPLSDGVYGRYYEGRRRDRLVTQARHLRIEPANRGYPGLKRQDDISASWNGFLKVRKAGAYKFYLQTDMPCVLNIDGKARLSSKAYKEETADMTLATGIHPMSLSGASVSGNTRVLFYWSGPDLKKSMPDQKALRTQPWFKDLTYLTNYVSNLASANKSTVKISETAIKNYGEVGHVYLAHALRYQGDSNAIAAAGMLLRTANPDFGPLVAERISTDPSTNTAPAFVRFLRANTNAIDTVVLTSLHTSLKKDETFRLRWLLPYFERILVNECKSNPAAFGKRVGAASAYKELQDYITRGVKSDNKTVVRWMLGKVGAAYPMQGLRGQYFAGAEKEKPYTDRFEPRINFTPATYPFPSGGTESNFWARWKGFVRAPKAGQYVFRINGDAKTVKLWIDDQPVTYSSQATVQLKDNAHAFKLELTRLGTNAAPVLAWSGPGLPNQVVSNHVFRVIPWE